MAKIIGDGGDVTAGATAAHVSEWSLNVSNEVQDVTDVASSGWAARIGGINSAELTFKCWWGGIATTLSTLFAIGTQVAATLDIGKSGASITGNFVITSFGITNNVKNAVEFTCTAQSTGVVTLPA